MQRKENNVGNLALFFFFFSFLPSTQASQDVSSSILGGPESVLATRANAEVGLRGMVVSDDKEASKWGAEILQRGGNAIDATVAIAFMLAVTRPHYASLGGGGFLVYCPAPKKKQRRVETEKPPCVVIDFREEAPKAARANMFVRDGKLHSELSRNGALASGVPGAVAGLLAAHKKYGSLKRAELLEKPIEKAGSGYRFTSHSEKAANVRWHAMNEEAKRIFGCKKVGSKKLEPCPPGTNIKQPDLKEVLQRISEKGSDGFYSGETAKNIVEGIQKAGGIITLEDLKNYVAMERPPLYGSYHDWDIVSMPPPSSGGAIILQLFRYAELAKAQGQFSKGFGHSQTIHALAHAMALAFSDRSHHYGDPDFVNVPTDLLLSSTYLSERWKTFNPAKIHLPKGPGVNDREQFETTHFSVSDSDGNMVALTTTVNDNFGSGFVPPGTGIVMNNEMNDFVLQPGVPNLFGLVGDRTNAIAPGKRPLSSMSPTIVRYADGTPAIAIGAAGGPRIPTAVFLSLFNRLEFDLQLPDAVAASRIHHQWRPKSLFIEKLGFPYDTVRILEKKGYNVQIVPQLGKVHALERYRSGRVWGYADLRGEGDAIAEALD